jgi:ribosomal protein S18 acetylase RimI-like enzyme
MAHVCSDQREGLFKLRLIAIATSARGRGGAVARECLDETLTRIESTLEPGVDGLVYGLVDVNNGASQRLLKHFDFTVQQHAPVEDPELEMWVTRIHGR